MTRSLKFGLLATLAVLAVTAVACALDPGAYAAVLHLLNDPRAQAGFLAAEGVAAVDTEMVKTALKTISADVNGFIAAQKDRYGELETKNIELQARLNEVEQKAARPKGDSSAGAADTPGRQFVESEGFKWLGTRRAVVRHEVKASITTITSTTSGTGAAGGTVVPDFDDRIIKPAIRRLTIRNLLTILPTISNAVEYVKETGYQNMAAPTAEGDLKPQSDMAFTQSISYVRTIAHWVLVSNQIMDDAMQLQAYIDTRMRDGLAFVEEQEILLGDGTGQHLSGLVHNATAFDGGLREIGDTPIDTVRRGLLQLELAFYQPSALVVNPIDWALMETTKDNNGRYIFANPQKFSAPLMWSVNVISTPAMSAGNFMVGDFQAAATLYDRQQSIVEVSTEDSDNFRKNLITVRAEQREALAVVRPDALIYGSLTAPGS